MIMLLVVFNLTQTHLNNKILHVPAATFVKNIIGVNKAIVIVTSIIVS